MIKLLKNISIVISIILSLHSCNKDQHCINRLEGNWLETERITNKNGNTFVDTLNSDGIYSYTFASYASNNVTEGNLTIQYNQNKPVIADVTRKVEYQVLDKCSTLFWSESDTTITDDVNAKIISITKETIELTWSETINNDFYTYTITLEKQ